jgi:hypothetical protein
MTVRQAHVYFTGQGSYSPSKAHTEPQLDGETKDAWEARTWLSKAHVDAKGRPYIQPVAFKWALTTAAKMLGLQVPGRGKATFTKFFESGVVALDPVVIAPDLKNVIKEPVFANSDGVRGSGKRVQRFFPLFQNWDGVVIFHVLAPEIDERTFEKVVQQAGTFVGVGRFRPEKGGIHGRFNVNKIEWVGGLAKAA